MQKTRNSAAGSLAATLLVLIAACGTGAPVEPQKQFRVRHQNPAELDTLNGLLSVSISDSCLSIDLQNAPGGTDTTLGPTDPLADDVCGISANGLSPSMLGLDGLRADKIKTKQFDRWFNQDPYSANQVMKYLTKCALQDGEVLNYASDSGASYSWPGVFGLAPRWASGQSVPEDEQQLVSACVAAHANKYGAHVLISVLGRRADGSAIPTGEGELASFPITEGCFFGNLFHNDGVFSGDDRPISLGDADTSLRACALPDRSGGGASSNCAPMKYAGKCSDICTRDSSGLYYSSCQVKGKSYKAISTRIQPNVNYTCGDGICQVTEKCGTGTTWDNCALDCGPCN